MHVLLILTMSLTNCVLGHRGNQRMMKVCFKHGLLATSELVLFRYCVVSLMMGLTVANGEIEQVLLLLGCSDGGKHDDDGQSLTVRASIATFWSYILYNYCNRNYSCCYL